ncbi:MAG: IS30 family transposase [Muribaculaceae bacterium]|nr:IS30 family transposase [Muribaculaceae bacterium]
MYKQLTSAQRYTISTMRQNGFSLQAIADELNRIELEASLENGDTPPTCLRSASTISRELRPNQTKTGKYNPKTAHDFALIRRERIVRNTALKPGVVKEALRLLKEKRWSPEQISGYLRKKDIHISKERIYQEIRKKPDLHQYCHHRMKYRRHQEKAYRTAGKSMIPDRVSIHDRPKEADGTRFGDWEMDLVVGRENKSAVLTLVERSRNMFLQSKLPSKRPEDVEKAVVRLLVPFKRHVLTITTDNGMEFRNHRNIAKALNCTVYFADPYCSGQKGAVENANKIFREFFPKGTDFRKVTQPELNKVQYQINDRPRKKLDFSTPKIEFYRCIE